MKRKISFGIAVLMILVACLFVSCNSEVSTTAQANDGKLVYATFDKSSKGVQRPDSETFIQSYVIDSITDVYWMYSATKADAGGATGATEGKRVNTGKGLTGNIGPLSKGYWNFTLDGYKWTGEGSDPTTESTTDFSVSGYTHVFAGSASSVLLNVDGTTAQKPAPIDITVNLVTVGTGWITVSNNFRFYWKNDGASSTGAGDYELKLKVYVNDELIATSPALTYVPATVNDDEYYTLDSNWVIPAAAGDLTYTVKLVHPLSVTDDIVYRSGVATSKVYAGQTTMIDATMIEGLQVDFVVFNAESTSPVIVSTSANETTETEGSVSFTTAFTPAGGTTVSDNKTTVDISNAGEVIPVDATYKLGVETSNIIAAGTKFSVSSGSTAVASVDLTLTKTDNTGTTTVSDFGTGAATVTTYIAKNLTGVAFFYGNTAFTKVSSDTNLSVNQFYYEGTTGKLVFKTGHFSEFYVTSTDEAFNATQGKAFATFGLSITSENYERGDIVVLLKNISVSESTNASGDIQKGLTIDGNGKTITCVGTGGTGGYVLNFCDPGDSEPERYEIKNLTINSTKSQAAILFNSHDSRYLFEASSTYQGYYFPSENAENNRNEAILSNITINSEGECIYSNGMATVTAYNCTLNRNGQFNSTRKSIYLSAAMIGYSGVLNLYDCVVTSDCNGIASFETGSILNVYGDTVITSTFDSLDTNTKQQYSDTSFASGKAVYCINGDYDPYQYDNHQYASYSSINIQSGIINGGVLLAQKNIKTNKVGPSFRATLTLATGVTVNGIQVPSTLSMTTSANGKWKPNESYTEFVSAN